MSVTTLLLWPLLAQGGAALLDCSTYKEIASARGDLHRDRLPAEAFDSPSGWNGNMFAFHKTVLQQDELLEILRYDTRNPAGAQQLHFHRELIPKMSAHFATYKIACLKRGKFTFITFAHPRIKPARGWDRPVTVSEFKAMAARSIALIQAFEAQGAGFLYMGSSAILNFEGELVTVQPDDLVFVHRLGDEAYDSVSEFAARAAPGGFRETALTNRSGHSQVLFRMCSTSTLYEFASFLKRFLQSSNTIPRHGPEAVPFGNFKDNLDMLLFQMRARPKDKYDWKEVEEVFVYVPPVPAAQRPVGPRRDSSDDRVSPSRWREASSSPSSARSLARRMRSLSPADNSRVFHKPVTTFCRGCSPLPTTPSPHASKSVSPEENEDRLFSQLLTGEGSSSRTSSSRPTASTNAMKSPKKSSKFLY